MLTIKLIEAAKPKEKSYRLSDSGGLFLFISKGGGKIWRFRYRKDGKEQTYVIGSYPEISLIEAVSFTPLQNQLSLLVGHSKQRKKHHKKKAS